MNTSRYFAAVFALALFLAAWHPALAAPLDNRFFGYADDEAIARPSTGEMRVFGDPATQAAYLSLVWPQGTVASFAGDALDRPERGLSGDPGARNGFARMLASETGGGGFPADPRFRGNPYLALGTWGGDGRAILRNIAVADSGRGTGPSVFVFDTGRAIEAGFDGFGLRGGNIDDNGDAPTPFDGQPMFTPSGFPLQTALGSGPGSGGAPGSGGGPGSGDGPGSGGGSGSGAGPGSGGDPGSGGGPGSGGDPGPGAGPGSGGGSAPIPVPEPGMIGILILAFAATLGLRSRSRWFGFAATLGALAFLPGLAFAGSGDEGGMRDWERLCNGTGGVTPELIAEGCSAVIGSGDESLGDVAIAYNNRGNALRAQEKYEEAARDYDNAILLAPADPFPYRNRGLVRGLMGQYELALVDFNQAIRLKADYASAYLGRGFAEEQLGQSDKAQADFAKAAKLDPKLAAVIPASEAGLERAQ